MKSKRKAMKAHLKDELDNNESSIENRNYMVFIASMRSDNESSVDNIFDHGKSS
jgi:hypothetical protein